MYIYLNLCRTCQTFKYSSPNLGKNSSTFADLVIEWSFSLELGRVVRVLSRVFLGVETFPGTRLMGHVKTENQKVRIRSITIRIADQVFHHCVSLRRRLFTL